MHHWALLCAAAAAASAAAADNSSSSSSPRITVGDDTCPAGGGLVCAASRGDVDVIAALLKGKAMPPTGRLYASVFQAAAAGGYVATTFAEPLFPDLTLHPGTATSSPSSSPTSTRTGASPTSRPPA